MWFDIVEINDKTATGYLYIFRQDGLYSTYPAISGPHGKGYLPIGNYHVVSCFEKPDVPTNKAYKRYGIPWLAGIIPQFETDRNDLAVHPDGNVPGSLGCIGITDRDMLAKIEIEDLLVSYGTLNLKVS